MKLFAPARVAIVAIVGAVALAGCSTVNPIVTEKDYAASDGLQVTLGDVRGQNLLIVTTGEGEPASLTGSFYNKAESDADILIALDGTNVVTLTVPAKTQFKLGLEGDASVLGLSPAAPGRIADVAIQSAATGTITTPIPVVDGTLPEHQPELDALATADIPS